MPARSVWAPPTAVGIPSAASTRSCLRASRSSPRAALCSPRARASAARATHTAPSALAHSNRTGSKRVYSDRFTLRHDGSSAAALCSTSPRYSAM